MCGFVYVIMFCVLSVFVCFFFCVLCLASPVTLVYTELKRYPLLLIPFLTPFFRPLRSGTTLGQPTILWKAEPTTTSCTPASAVVRDDDVAIVVVFVTLSRRHQRCHLFVLFQISHYCCRSCLIDFNKSNFMSTSSFKFSFRPWEVALLLRIRVCLTARAATAQLLLRRCVIVVDVTN